MALSREQRLQAVELVRKQVDKMTAEERARVGSLTVEELVQVQDNINALDRIWLRLEEALLDGSDRE